MKIELDTNDTFNNFSEAIVVASLKESVEICKLYNLTPKDKKENKAYATAVKLVLKHWEVK